MPRGSFYLSGPATRWFMLGMLKRSHINGFQYAMRLCDEQGVQFPAELLDISDYTQSSGSTDIYARLAYQRTPDLKTVFMLCVDNIFLSREFTFDRDSQGSNNVRSAMIYVATADYAPAVGKVIGHIDLTADGSTPISLFAGDISINTTSIGLWRIY